MKSIEFIVDGEIVGKGRPRFTTAGGHGRAYTPKKTADYEKKVRTAYKNAAKENGFKKLEDVPVSVIISAYFGIPKSVSKSKIKDMLDWNIFPTKKPDVDNIAKIILDALNGIAFSDDKNVVDVVIRKRYNHNSHVSVVIMDVTR